MINKYINLLDYSNEPKELNRYNTLLTIIQEGLTEAAKRFDWPIIAFESAYQKVLESEFRNEFVILLPKLSNNKKHSASITAHATKDKISTYVMLENKQTYEKKIIPLISLPFYLDDFSGIIHKLQWISNEELIISNKDKEINFKFSIQNDLPQLFLTPRIHNKTYLEEELALLNPLTSKEEYLVINNRHTANLSQFKIEPNND